MIGVPRVLLIVCDSGERAALQEILASHAELRWACNPQEMAQQMAQQHYDAVFCARTLCTGSWSEVVAQLRQLCPQLPVIILSETAGEKEWVEVLAAGAFDLLALPCYERTLLSVMEHAVASGEARGWHDAASPQSA